MLKKYSVKELEVLEFKRRRYVRQSTQIAIKKGLLVKPSCCELCKENHHDIDAHHVDYGRPLNVAWLCPSCHGKAHTNLHYLNPKNNAQTPLPEEFQFYKNVTVTFTIHIDNFLALKSAAASNGKTISQIMRETAEINFPVQSKQLEFNFMESLNEHASTIEHKNLFTMVPNEKGMPFEEDSSLQINWRERDWDAERMGKFLCVL
jgi:hypothetical protein